MKWICVVIVCGVFSVVQSQNPCITPNGESSECISIYKCKVFTAALQTRTPEVIRFMRESRCGYMEDPLVCCGSVANYQAVVTTAPPPNASTPLEHQNRHLLDPKVICGHGGTQDKEFGGNVTGLDEFPCMTLPEYIAKNGQSAGYSCGGVLINKRYIVTSILVYLKVRSHLDNTK